MAEQMQDRRPDAQPSVAGPQASPEDQSTYDLIVSQAMDHIYDERSSRSVMKQLRAGPTPAQAIGKVAGQLGVAAWMSAKGTGNQGKLNQDVMLSAAAEVVDQLFELGQAMGYWEVESQEQAQRIVQEATMEAVRIYGERLLQEGDIDSDAAKHQMDQEIAREQRGMTATPVAAGVRQAIQGAQRRPRMPAGVGTMPAGAQGGLVGSAMGAMP